MKYACPHCNSEFDLTESGRYECPVCQNKFDFTFPAPSPVKVSQPEPIANRCPFCKLEIPAGAQKCGHCGEWISGNRLSQFTYVLLSFFFGHFGVHHFYSGKSIKGVLCFITTIILLAVSINEPGMLIGVAVFGTIQFIFALLTDVNSAKNTKPTKFDKAFFWILGIIAAIILACGLYIELGY